MIPQMEHLSPEDRSLLFRAPALVSLTACLVRNGIQPERKADALKLAHLKTFTALPLLQPYYAEVESQFNAAFDRAEKEYAPYDERCRAALRSELNRVQEVIGKLEPGYGHVLSRSLNAYARHVSKADHSVFQDFLFGFCIPGLSA